MVDQGRWLSWFESLSIGNGTIVGGENASLGEMYRELRPKGIPVPNGLAVLADAYRYVLDAAAWEPLHAGLDHDDDLARRGRRAGEVVYSGAGLPSTLGRLMRSFLPSMATKSRLQCVPWQSLKTCQRSRSSVNGYLACLG